MNTEVKHHPSSELLNQFVQGDLATGNSVVISAHLELCLNCQEKAKELQAHAISSWVDPSTSTQQASSGKRDQADIVSSIVKAPQIKSEEIEEPEEIEIEVLQKSIKLPRVLAKAAAAGLKWNNAGGGISDAQIFLDNETACEFIYMAPGSKAPVHTHLGSETTLILDGSFKDDMGEYKPSDFVVRDAQHHHQPSSEEGCLCFAVLDSPLQFTQGLARLLNPLNRYKFKKAISQSI